MQLNGFWGYMKILEDGSCSSCRLHVTISSCEIRVNLSFILFQIVPYCSILFQIVLDRADKRGGLENFKLPALFKGSLITIIKIVHINASERSETTWNNLKLTKQ